MGASTSERLQRWREGLFASGRQGLIIYLCLTPMLLPLFAIIYPTVVFFPTALVTHMAGVTLASWVPKATMWLSMILSLATIIALWQPFRKRKPETAILQPRDD